MPIATHTLQGDFSALVGEVATIRATIHTNSTDDAWVNDTDDEIRLGGAVLALNAAGEFTITLPTSTGTGLQYQVTAEYVNADRQRKTWQSGWFDLTADADLADKANDSTLRVNTTLGDQLAARIDGYTDHGDVSGTLAVDPATGTHVLNATDALLVTLAEEANGTIVTLYVIGGAENVTVDGIADLELTDGAFASFVRIRGAWVLASAGAGGTPATPDTTPPTAVTDLAVTPGEDGVTATATFTPATDTESAVKYRYRLYPTGSTAPAWPTSGSQYNLAGSPINLTGLTAGEDYTMELQAYSAGGSAAADSATFTTTTPAGWNVQIHDTFTGDRTIAGSVPDTVGSATWTTTATSLVATGGRAVEVSDATGGRNTIALSPSGATRVRATMNYKSGVQPNSSQSEMTLVLTKTPPVKIDFNSVVVQGYNGGGGYQTLIPSTPIPNAGGVGVITAERDGNMLRVFSGETLLGEVELAYVDYVTNWSPTTFEMSAWKTDDAYIDDVKVEMYS